MQRRCILGAAAAAIASDNDAACAERLDMASKDQLSKDLGPYLDKLNEDIDAFSKDLDKMADQNNPIVYEVPGGVTFEFPNPVDYVIGEGQSVKTDIFKGRKESIFNQGVRADPISAFRTREARASERWTKLAAELEKKLSAARPPFQDIRSIVLLKKVPVEEAMASAANVIQGDGQDAFDKETLLNLQTQFQGALDMLSRRAKAGDGEGAIQALVGARTLFDEWRTSPLGKVTKR